MAARLGTPPAPEHFTRTDKFGRERAKYETRKSELMKDYKDVPSEGDIARTVDSYGKKLAEERAGYEGKPSEPKPVEADKVIKTLIKEGTLVKEGDGYVAKPQPEPTPPTRCSDS